MAPDLSTSNDVAPARDRARGARLLENFRTFDARVRRAQSRLAAGDHDGAAVEASIAAMLAAHRHCGVFASARLERLLRAIGTRDEPDATAWTESGAPYRRILHVCTQLAPVGGLTKMLALWIGADARRTNSVALTQHRGAVDARIRASVRASGGTVHHLNHAPGALVAWARELRRIARGYDAVVLHSHCEDVVPVIAFATPAACPPVLLLNHADHLFWLGGSIGRTVINLREAARTLSIARRGIEPRRNALLPTLITLPARQRSRAQAKRALGLPEDSVVLTSVARGAKYRNVGALTYADRHVDLLAAHPRARLIVVGPGDRPDWASAVAATQGRIAVHPEMPDPRLYFEAADIYLDSYPFVSSTSMLEAAAYGLPLVTRFEGPQAAEIVAINHPGLDRSALVARSPEAYAATVGRLITDAAEREAAGEASAAAIARLYTPQGWVSALDAVYAHSRTLDPPTPCRTSRAPVREAPHVGEPDLRHQEMFGSEMSEAEMTKNFLGMLPFAQRRRSWSELRRAGGFGSARASLRGLVPEWLVRTLKHRARLALGTGRLPASAS